MAVTQKTTSTLNVIVQDANNGDVTFKLDNPKANIDLQDVKEAFDFVFTFPTTGGGYYNLLCTKTGYDLISVVGAEKVTTVVTKETLE